MREQLEPKCPGVLFTNMTSLASQHGHCYINKYPSMEMLSDMFISNAHFGSILVHCYNNVNDIGEEGVLTSQLLRQQLPPYLCDVALTRAYNRGAHKR